MPIDVRPCSSHEELRDALNAISHYFGNENSVEDAERFARWIELERMHAAWDDGRIVGGAGAFTYELSVPGGALVPAAGVTVVGVLPSHRRRGVLTAMMRAQLEDVRRRREPLAYLWASEATIYGRFGYGLASLMGAIELPRDRAAYAMPFAPRGRVRLVGKDEAAQTFPAIHEAVMRERPGMFRRTPAWWETRRLDNPPHAKAPLNRALLELDGEPVAYALYRVNSEFTPATVGDLQVLEALARTPEALAEMWRWLLDMDWMATIKAGLLPVDHPLVLLLAEPRRMSFTLNDGVWVRLVDVGAALAARAYAADDPLVIEVRDPFLRENDGRYRVTGERTDDGADIALDVSALATVYLGGFTFRELRDGGRLDELAPGAVARADRVFGTWPKPWCPEIF